MAQDNNKVAPPAQGGGQAEAAGAANGAMAGLPMRLLMTAVVVMGLLILGLATAIIVEIARRATDAGTHDASPVVLALPVAGRALTIQPLAEHLLITWDDNGDDAPERVFIVDPEDGGIHRHWVLPTAAN